MDTALVFNLLARDDTGRELSKMRQGFSVGGVAAGVALGEGISGAVESALGVIGGMMDTVMGKSRSDSLTAAQLGLSPDQVGRVAKLSGDIYGANFGGSIEEVNGALRGVFQQGLAGATDTTDAHVQAITQKLLTVSAVVGEDTDRVSAAVSSMMKSGLAKNSEEAMDLLVAATQKGLNKSGDLIDTMEEYSVGFKALGITGPQAMGLIEQSLNGGARSSDLAADAVKEFGIRAIDGSKTTSDAFAALGVDGAKVQAALAGGGAGASAAFGDVVTKLKAVKDPALQAELAVSLFGTQSEDLKGSLLSMDMAGSGATFATFAGTVDAAAATMAAGVAPSFDSLKRAGQEALIDVFEKAAPTIEKVTTFITAHSAGISQLITIALPVIGIIKGITLVQGALNVVMAANPIGLIVIAVAALVAGLIILWTKSDAFREFWIGVWEAIKTAFNFAVDAIKAGIGFVIDAFNLWKNTASAVIDFLRGAFTLLMEGVKFVLDAIVAGFHWWLDQARAVVNAVVGVFGWLRDQIAGHIDRARAVLHWLVEAATVVGRWIRDRFEDLLGFFSGLPGRLRAHAGDLFGFLREKMGEAKEWVRGRVEDVVGFFVGLPARMVNAARGLFDPLKDSFKTAVNWLIDRWNGFQLKLGGGSILGVSIPSLTLDTPDIPRLASGGVVKAVSGGRLIVAGEGGQDEAIIPLSKLGSLVSPIGNQLLASVAPRMEGYFNAVRNIGIPRNDIEDWVGSALRTVNRDVPGLNAAQQGAFASMLREIWHSDIPSDSRKWMQQQSEFLNRLRSNAAFRVTPPSAPSAPIVIARPATTSAAPVRLVVDATAGDQFGRLLVEVLRRFVRVEGGGNVQAALGIPGR